MAFGWGSVIGAVIGGVSSAFGASQQNKAAQSAAETQMAFQRESAQNQYQWAMADMRKAGLNPILAYKQGGSGTLGGSSYTPANVGQAAMTGAAGGVSSAIAARRQNQELQNMKADVRLKNEQSATEKRKQIQIQGQSHLTMEQRRALRQQILINIPNVTSARALETLNKTSAGRTLTTIEAVMRRLGLKSAIPTRR